MTHDKFAKRLKIVIIGTTLIGILICFLLIPYMGDYMVQRYPEYKYAKLPWMIFIYISGIPCFIAMGLSWKITSNIGADKSFCKENAKLFNIFSKLALVDSIFFFMVSLIFELVGLNHPGILLFSFLIVFFGLAVYICMGALSYLVSKATVLQEDNDLTI